MSEIKTCEEYVIAELQDTKNRLDQVSELLDKSYNNNGALISFLQKLRAAIELRRSSTSGELYCTMNIWENYDPELFEEIIRTFQFEEDCENLRKDNVEDGDK